MLDECKGDKFEEVLVLFSAAVVRKKIGGRRKPKYPPIAQKLGSSTSVMAEDVKLLLPLAIAHRAALSASVERRASLREKIQQFEQSIEQRRDETRRLAEEIAEGQSQLALPLQERSAEIVRRQINDNWVGSVESRDMLLYGRQSLLGSASPSSDFGQIWQDCRDGKDLELHNSKPGMLESLEHRIRQQNERVRRWKDFQKRFDQKSVYTNSGIQSPSTRPALIFSEHQSIRVDRSAPETEGTASRPIGAKYAETISCLKTGLDGVRSRKQQSLSQVSTTATELKENFVEQQQTAGAEEAMGHAAGSPDLSTAQELQESRYSGSRDLSPHNGHLPLERALFSPVKGYIGREHVDKEDATLVEANRTSSPPVTGFTGSTLRDEAATSPWQPSPLQTPLQCHDAPTLSKPGKSFDQPSPSRSQPPPDHSYPPKQVPLCEDSSQAQPETMASPPATTTSLTTMPPPPSTHRGPRPSLSERALQSMRHSYHPNNPIISPSHSTTISEEPNKDEYDDLTLPTTTLDRRASLADRTRYSISQHTAHPPHSSKPRKNRPGHTRSRSSLYPVNQFETPVKAKRDAGFGYGSVDDGGLDTGMGMGTGMGRRDITPREKLFSDDAEYDSVFKSRPKIAMSPVLSPSVLWEGQLEEGDEGLGSSPLGGR